MATRGEVRKPLVAARGLERTFQLGSQQLKAVHDVDLDVRRGEFLAIMGRSGSGKTTLLNLLGGLDTPTAGEVLVDGQNLHIMSPRESLELRRKKIGFVFQSFGLLPLLSAYENVELPLRIVGETIKKRRERTWECLEMVGLTHRARHRPYELSGGEQQRVAIARAIVNNPLLLLADEPTGELDSATAAAIFGLFRHVVDEEKVTVIATTHDKTLLELATRIKELKDGTFVNGS